MEKTTSNLLRAVAHVVGTIVPDLVCYTFVLADQHNQIFIFAYYSVLVDTRLVFAPIPVFRPRPSDVGCDLIAQRFSSSAI